MVAQASRGRAQSRVQVEDGCSDPGEPTDVYRLSKILEKWSPKSGLGDGGVADWEET